MFRSDINTLIEKGLTVVQVRNEIYDITSFVNEHPGGVLVLQHSCGKDITNLFIQFHEKAAWTVLHRFHIGTLHKDERISMNELEKDYNEINKFISDNGYDQINPLVVLWIVVRSFLWLLVTLLCFQHQDKHPYFLTIGAICLGMFFQQMAFLGHDCGHNTMFRNCQWDICFGYFFGNIASGISLAWWKTSHNVHHVVCNSIEHDPDIQHLPIVACSSNILLTTDQPYSFWKWHSLFYSSFHEKWVGMNGICMMILSTQHIIFYPLMTVGRFNLYFQSWHMLLTNTHQPLHRGLEILFLALHFLLHGSLVYFYTADHWSLLYVIFVSHAVAGILHIQIVLSHFAMEVYSGYKKDWISTQVLSSMNIECSPWMDWFHGGLQFQIEHHLFPRVPRYHLRALSKLVVPFCSKHKLPHISLSFFEANYKMYKALQTVAHNAWNMNDVVSNQMLLDALNAQG